jgi:hypothetical protein
VPFLPAPESAPRGPVDPPLLDGQAPQNWWEDRVKELFDAASFITGLLRELEDEGAALYTPFAGFCNFSAATMNVYTHCFPSMNLGRSKESRSIMEENLEYLDRFRRHWPIGQAWWTTIQQTKTLYEHRSQDPRTYHGKTRDDFIRLEASIHDVTGRSPSYTGRLRNQISPAEASSVEAEADTTEIQHSETHGDDVPNEFLDAFSTTEVWDENWPLWGEMHSIPFSYNLEALLQ